LRPAESGIRKDVNSFASLNIQNLHRVISINRGEDPAASIVYRHVVKAPLDIGHGNDSHQEQWSEFVI